MKKILISTVLVAVISIGVKAQSMHKQLRHVVLFGWKAGADTAAIRSVVTAFKALPKQIPTVRSFEWGVNNSPEHLNQGLTHCFVLTFDSEKDRDAYLVNPAHVAFTKLLPNLMEKVTVVDYWVEK